MKHVTRILAIALLAAFTAAPMAADPPRYGRAESGGAWGGRSNADRVSPWETVEDARARHGARRYETYRQRGEPLGGYRESFGDPAPPGTIRPGHAAPYDREPGYRRW